MKRYDTYKDSGVQWLGDIPSHWELLRNKNIFTTHYEAVGNRMDIPLLSLSIDGVKLRDIESGKGKFPKDFEKYNVVYPNQIIFCLFDVDETPRTVGLSLDYGMITNAYSTFNISDDVIARFITYYYLAIDNVKALRPYYSGLRKVVQTNRFLQLKVPIPPKDEQEGIVAFLDEKTAEIDELVRQVEHEIELLKEYKQAEIARVVTRGLNPNAPLKPSGISWIGDIPQHWDVRFLSQVASEYYVSNKNIHHQNLLSLSYGAIIRKDINGTDGLLPASFDTYQVVKDGIIVLRLTDLQNDHRSLRVGIAKEEGIVTSAYTSLQARNSILPNYLYYQLHVNDIHKVFYGMGDGLRQSLNYAGLKRLLMVLPPLAEQQEIVEYIDRKTTEIDRLVVELTYQVEYLKEYKQRLIADVVTGKINVQRN